MRQTLHLQSHLQGMTYVLDKTGQFACFTISTMKATSSGDTPGKCLAICSITDMPVWPYKFRTCTLER